MILSTLLEIAAFFFSVFVIRRYTSIDPHNVKETTSTIKLSLYCVVLTSCYIALSYAEFDEKWVIVSASFIIYSIYMPAINPPVKFQKDEEESWIQRFFQAFKTKLGGSLIIKLVLIVVPLIFIKQMNSLWYIGFLILGIVLMVGKSAIINTLILDSEGEWDKVQSSEEKEKLIKKINSQFWIALLAITLFSFTFGKEIIIVAKLNSENWSSFSSILLGSVLGFLVEAISE